MDPDQFEFMDQPEPEEISPERVPCRLYPVKGQEGAYVLPVPHLERDRLLEYEYHVDELENLLEVVLNYEDEGGVYVPFDIEDDDTLEKALSIEKLVLVAPEELERLKD